MLPLKICKLCLCFSLDFSFLSLWLLLPFSYSQIWVLNSTCMCFCYFSVWLWTSLSGFIYKCFIGSRINSLQICSAGGLRDLCILGDNWWICFWHLTLKVVAFFPLTDSHECQICPWCKIQNLPIFNPYKEAALLLWANLK